MAGIFISYRRDDSEAEARLLAKALIGRFGEQFVFFDRTDIRPGEKYPERLKEKLLGCDALLAVIGRDWLIDRQGRNRLANEDDWVKREISTALNRGIRVVPTLVKSTELPSASDLPGSLQSLLEYQCAALRGDSWDRDVASLLDLLAISIGAVTNQNAGSVAGASASLEPGASGAMTSSLCWKKFETLTCSAFLGPLYRMATS